MAKYLRPKAVAEELSISLVTLYRHAKTDPDFPQLISLSQGCTVISEEELAEYIAKKAKKTVKKAVNLNQPTVEAIPA